MRKGPLGKGTGGKASLRKGPGGKSASRSSAPIEKTVQPPRQKKQARPEQPVEVAPVLVTSSKAAPSISPGSNQQDRAIKSRELAIEIARTASGSKCHQVVVLDVTGLSPVCDFLVLGTGTSSRQMRSTVDDAVENGEALGYPANCVSGTSGELWMLADFVDVVLHLFTQDSREYYDLDSLWGDARPVAWQPA